MSDISAGEGPSFGWPLIRVRGFGRARAWSADGNSLCGRGKQRSIPGRPLGRGATPQAWGAGPLSAVAHCLVGTTTPSAAGLVPVPRESGRRTGNLHRPKWYSRRLRRVYYLPARTSMRRFAKAPTATTT
ncbi:transposase [Streptomyces sp. NBC_01304]|uniref:transposase n=1 Tax=Streptomyces sp. NBC_01304 TaxID=2903818 RepID=UPI003FA3B808